MSSTVVGPASPVRQPAPIQPKIDSIPNEELTVYGWIIFCFILVIAWMMRTRNPEFSTAYMDESVYVVYGRMFLTHHFEAPLDTPLQWSFGWYLWPAMAALADRIGGLVGLREMAAGLGTISVAATFGFARRVFSNGSGLVAAAIMAVLGPAILVSRIATRDTGSICFFALGLWAFAAGWQDNKKRYWAAAALMFFAAFLCKYMVAIYFPFLVIIALFKGKRPLFLFALPMFAACAVYGMLHYSDLIHLLRYGSAYGSLRSPDASGIYFLQRRDFWLIAAVGFLAFLGSKRRLRAMWMYVGAAIILVFQWKSRADYDYWKHTNYALLFLVPLAGAGIIFMARRLLPEKHIGRISLAMCACVALMIPVAFLGQTVGQFLFWPNVEPVQAYFEGRLTAQDRVLVDDTVFRYYFSPPLHQPQIADPMYFHYRDGAGRDLYGLDAYKAAVSEGAFNYIVLDGGIGGEASSMDAAIRPVLSAYRVELEALDPVLGHKIEIYAKPGSASETSTVHILAPESNTIITTKEDRSTLGFGIVQGAQPGSTALFEVFTDHWYAQGPRVPVAADGTFRQTIFLGGEGGQQCYHLVRARVFDLQGNPTGFALNYGIGRAGGACKSNH
jgi:hypothetical protein